MLAARNAFLEKVLEEGVVIYEQYIEGRYYIVTGYSGEQEWTDSKKQFVWQPFAPLIPTIVQMTLMRCWLHSEANKSPGTFLKTC